MVDPYLVLLTLAGALTLGLAGLPLLIRDLPLSVPVVLLVAGGMAALLPLPDPIPALHEHPEVTERVTELLVIISLMGAGLKLDTPFGWRRWGTTWRLLGIAMPLSIASIALLGWGFLGMAPATAVLLGAVLAPTDPVLAADVQVGPAGEGDQCRVRFALTSEAGLNDGLAFPFVNLAVAISLHHGSAGIWPLEWLAYDVVWKLAAGVLVGIATGRLAGWLLFQASRAALARGRDGFVVVGLTILGYGLTELVHGYGFLAVFAAAVTLRRVERGHEYHRRLHEFAEEIERLVLGVLVLLLGASFVSVFLGLVTLELLAAACIILLVIRPVSGMVSLAGSPEPLHDQVAISFFGIRGMGSLYYVGYAVTETGFDNLELLWTIVVLVIVLSILLHGVAATPAMRLVAARTARQAEAA